MIRTFLNNYFGFNRQQRNGLMVLIVISFLLLVLRVTYPMFIKPAPIAIKNLPLAERRLDSAYSVNAHFGKDDRASVPSAPLHAFDPNTVTLQELMALGFRERTAKTFLKFRSKGFVFKEKADLKKIYGISDAFYAKLEPYLVIAAADAKSKDNLIPGKTASKQEAAAQPPKAIELNTCDSATLVALNGIGPSYARRILRYRQALGGYVTVEQLKEVYGFPEELFEKIRSSFTADASLVKKIRLNSDDFKTVNRHPYLSFELTKAIFKQRAKSRITPDILKQVVNDEPLYQRILPYMDFN